MSASRSLPVWVWPVALGLFLVGAVVFGRAFKEERSRILRVERKLGTLQELQGLAETRLPITGAESRLAEVAGETLVDPLGWFAKENVKVEVEVLPAATLAGGVTLERRKATVRDEDPGRLNEALGRLQEVRPPWAVEQVALKALPEGRVEGTLILMSVSRKAATE